MVKLIKALTLALLVCLNLAGCTNLSNPFNETVEDLACADISAKVSSDVEDTLVVFNLKSERSFVRHCELVGTSDGRTQHGIILMGFDVIINGEKKELGALGQFAATGDGWEILKGTIIYDVYPSAK